MESLEGYSYYDTPTGPQYVRNGSTEPSQHLNNPVEMRRRNLPLSNPSHIKYHPYPYLRRSTKDVQESCIDAGRTDQIVDLGTIPNTVNPQSLKNGGAHSSINPSSTLSMQGFHNNAFAQFPTFVHQADNYSVAVDRRTSLSLEPQALLRAFAAEKTSSQMHYDSNSQHLQKNSWLAALSPSVGHGLLASTPSIHWPTDGMYQSSEADESSHSVPSPTVAKEEEKHSFITNHLKSATSPFFQVCDSPDVHSDTKLSHTSSAIQHHVFTNFQSANNVHEHTNQDFNVNETLFEYGPFFDNFQPQRRTSIDHSWSAHDIGSQDIPSGNNSSIDEADRPVPQVNLVGGYFAPADDTPLLVAPEINSQGNIRITRLPPKKTPVVYELPALSDMTVTQLKGELKRHGLSAIGKKSDLQERLKAHIGE